jgi:hypothetical protein
MGYNSIELVDYLLAANRTSPELEDLCIKAGNKKDSV